MSAHLFGRILALICIAGLPCSQQDLASQGRKMMLRRIDFSGASYFSAPMLQNSLKLARLNASVTPPMVEADIGMNLTPLLREFGFLTSSVEWKLNTEEGGDTELRVQISEGPQYRLATLDLVGITAFRSEDVSSKFDLQVGDVVNYRAVKGGLDRTLAMYCDNGYVDCSYIPTMDFDPDRRTAALRFEFVEGMQYRIGYVGFTGVGDQAEEDRLRLRIGLVPGEIYSETRQRAACAALREFGLDNDTVEVIDQKRGLLGLVFWLKKPD